MTVHDGQPCACGCGRTTRWHSSLDQPRAYIAGHQPCSHGNWGRDGVKGRTVRAIKAFTAEHGREPRVADWGPLRPAGAPSISTICNTFGSWSRAKAEAR